MKKIISVIICVIFCQLTYAQTNQSNVNGNNFGGDQVNGPKVTNNYYVTPPANSGPAERNSPPPASKDCASKNIGNYCFKNNTNVDLYLRLVRGPSNPTFYENSCTLQPGQSQCFYDLPVGEYIYSTQQKKAPNNSGFYTLDGTGNSNRGGRSYNVHGSVYVEQCESPTFNIR